MMLTLASKKCSTVPQWNVLDLAKRENLLRYDTTVLCISCITDIIKFYIKN